MDINQLLIESAQLLGLGMGAVFLILILLIVLIGLVARLVPEKPQPAAPSLQPGIPRDHIAAIVAAIRQYRKNR